MRFEVRSGARRTKHCAQDHNRRHTGTFRYGSAQLDVAAASDREEFWGKTGTAWMYLVLRANSCFCVRVVCVCGGIAAIITRHPLLIKSARQAGIAVCGLIFTATLSLVYLFFTDNYSVAYVVSHSNRDLSKFFKIAALWSGQEGSLLFWSFLLAVYVVSVLLTYRNKNGELMPYVGVILAGVQLFFLTISNFVASPFQSIGCGKCGR